LKSNLHSVIKILCLISTDTNYYTAYNLDELTNADISKVHSKIWSSSL